jgi:hypothetical protein
MYPLSDVLQGPKYPWLAHNYNIVHEFDADTDWVHGLRIDSFVHVEVPGPELREELRRRFQGGGPEILPYAKEMYGMPFLPADRSSLTDSCLDTVRLQRRHKRGAPETISQKKAQAKSVIRSWWTLTWISLWQRCNRSSCHQISNLRKQDLLLEARVY